MSSTSRGFSENFQYTIYHGIEGGHYDWHVDHGPLKLQRKFSISVQLSDASDYEGCDLEFHAGNRRSKPLRALRGAVIAFPSYVLHRVTPCTKGTRKALVAWTTGPQAQMSAIKTSPVVIGGYKDGGVEGCLHARPNWTRSLPWVTGWRRCAPNSNMVRTPRNHVRITRVAWIDPGPDTAIGSTQGWKK